jgi:hypothetical protein
MKQSSNTPLPRRQFLRQLMVLGGATSAGAIAFSSSAFNSAPPATARVSADTTSSKGYRLTKHIRTYYEKAQI